MCARGTGPAQGWKKIVPVVDKKAWLPAWQEVIILLAGTLTDPTLETRTDPALLLRLLADEQKDDYFRHRLALAGLCLPELPSNFRQAQSSIIDNITTTSFSLWWLYHNRDRAAVPHLTRMLPALAQVNGYFSRPGWEQERMPLLEWCCQQLHRYYSYEEPWVNRRAARALGQLGNAAARHPDILPTLLDRALCKEVMYQRVRWRRWGSWGTPLPPP